MNFFWFLQLVALIFLFFFLSLQAMTENNKANDVLKLAPFLVPFTSRAKIFTVSTYKMQFSFGYLFAWILMCNGLCMFPVSVAVCYGLYKISFTYASWLLIHLFALFIYSHSLMQWRIGMPPMWLFQGLDSEYDEIISWKMPLVRWMPWPKRIFEGRWCLYSVFSICWCFTVSGWSFLYSIYSKEYYSSSRDFSFSFPYSHYPPFLFRFASLLLMNLEQRRLV